MACIDQTMESAAGRAFDDGVYSISADMEPFNIGHGYPVPSENSYDPTGMKSWNQYLENAAVYETTGQLFDPSYSLPSDLAHAVGTLDFVSGDHAWPLGQGDAYRGADLAPFHTADSTTTENHSGIITQQADGHQQLLPVQQYHYQDVVPPITVSPDALSNHSAPELQPQPQPQQESGIDDEQQLEQRRAPEQQTGACLPKTSRPKSTAGTKRRNTVDAADAHQPAPVTKRRQQTSTKPVLAPVDAWTPPTPLTLHASTSSSSLTGSATSGPSPVLYKGASVLSLAGMDPFLIPDPPL
jgi:hypothetical protein